MHQQRYEIVPQISLIALFKPHVIPGDQVIFYASIIQDKNVANRLVNSLTLPDKQLPQTTGRKRAKHFWILSAPKLSQELPKK